ncbi:uncharacterized protein LOC34620418 [Cyclospora cayetanensis]|uniref:Uncharacterized protein LOC34620418 n=1 Tax=Cyclospora cayetanensis TaxID=88456 RepID=A0A6P6S118_9EIME|nr:uncharacterized protein LOC34620418 [Cyclospora cayetanensis]
MIGYKLANEPCCTCRDGQPLIWKCRASFYSGVCRPEARRQDRELRRSAKSYEELLHIMQKYLGIRSNKRRVEREVGKEKPSLCVSVEAPTRSRPSRDLKGAAKRPPHSPCPCFKSHTLRSPHGPDNACPSAMHAGSENAVGHPGSRVPPDGEETLGGSPEGCGNVEALVRELWRWNEQGQQETAAAAAFARAADAVPQLKEKLRGRKARTSGLMLQRRRLKDVTLGQGSAGTVAAPGTAASDTGASAERATATAPPATPGSSRPAAGVSATEPATIMAGVKESQSISNDSVLIDVSLQNREAEDMLFASCPALRPLLRRGISLLELPLASQQQQQQQHRFILLRRGLPKFFDLELDLLAIFMLQLQEQQKQQHQNRPRQKKLELSASAIKATLDAAAAQKLGTNVLASHQLAESLMSYCPPPSSNDNGKEEIFSVWALEKLNGEAAQISFCKELGAWVCCSKNVSLLLPVAVATAAATPVLDTAKATRAYDAEEAETTARGKIAHSEQRNKQQLQEAVSLLRLVGAERVVSPSFDADPPPAPRRETYALRVAAAWNRQLQQLKEHQVKELQQLLQEHTLVGELVGCAEKQHIVAAPTQQQQQKAEEEGRLVFFSLVPHTLHGPPEGPRGAPWGPLCLSPEVSLPLLQSLGVQTASVVQLLRASSPLELLLPLWRLERQEAERYRCDSEGLVLYFCCNTGQNSSNGNSRHHGVPTVFAFAKLKSGPYRFRRKLRERLKALFHRCSFWQAVSAAAVATAAATDTARAGDWTSSGIAATIKQAFASARAAPTATLASMEELGSAHPAATGETTAGAAAEAALRVQVSSAVGVYWSRFLEDAACQFGKALQQVAPRGFPEALLAKVVTLQEEQQQKEQKEQVAGLSDRLTQEEIAKFRCAAAFCCSLASAVLLALNCCPDPQQVFLEWQQQQGQRKDQLACTGRNGTSSLFWALVHAPSTSRSSTHLGGPLERFLVCYADLRPLDLLADCEAFAAATGAPLCWTAPPQALLQQLQQQQGTASSGTIQPLDVHKQHQEQLHGQQQHSQGIVCLVTPPLLLTAAEYEALREVCLSRGCRLLLKHSVCFSDCSYCPRSLKKQKKTGSASTKEGATRHPHAALVALWGLDSAGNELARERLRLLLQPQWQQEAQQGEWDGVAFVDDEGEVQQLQSAGGIGTLSEGSCFLRPERCLVASARVAKTLLSAPDLAVADAALSLLLSSCNKSLPKGVSSKSGEPHDSEESPQTTYEKAPMVPILRLPAIKKMRGPLSASRTEQWKLSLQQFIAAVDTLLVGPPQSSSGQGRVEGASDSCVWSCRETQGVRASVVALLPVGLPGSGKTTVLLEALRPALREELISGNTSSIDGVTGLFIWEGRTKPTAEAAATAATKSPVDIVCLLSSDEATGEILRSWGWESPTGALHQVCLEEAAAAGPTAAARMAAPCCPMNAHGGLHEGPPDGKTMKAAIAEGKNVLGKAQTSFFRALREVLTNRSCHEQQQQRPLRVLLVIDRNHPPNAVEPRFSDLQQLLRALQVDVLCRSRAIVNVATAALLLPPDAAPDGSSVLGTVPHGGCQQSFISWRYPWSVDVVLRCLYRVLTRGEHATLTGSTAGPHAAPREGREAQDIKALHICLSFVSCFGGFVQLKEFLQSHTAVDHVLLLQTVLPQPHLMQQEHQLQQARQQQQQLLLSALSSLKPFSHPITNSSVYEALAVSLRQFPPEQSIVGDAQGAHRTAITRTAAVLLQQLDDLFFSMESVVQQNQSTQQDQLQQKQYIRLESSGCGDLPQPRGDICLPTPEGGHWGPSNTQLRLRLPTFYSLHLGEDKETLSSLTEQLCAVVQNSPGDPSGASRDLSFRNVCATLTPVERPHVTTFFLGGGVLRVTRGEISAANKWLDRFLGPSLQASPLQCFGGKRSPITEKGGPAGAGFSSMDPRILRLEQLLASRRQTGLSFKLRVSHLVFADFGLACGALVPLCPVVPLADPPANIIRGDLQGVVQDHIFKAHQFAWGLEDSVQEIEAGEGRCGLACGVCGPHEVRDPIEGLSSSSKVTPFCIAAYHYAHVTLALGGTATAVMSNDVLEAADKAISKGMRDGKLRIDTVRPFRSGAPCNTEESPEVSPESSPLDEAYDCVECYPVSGGSDPQELIIFTGAPVRGTSTRLWVWTLPPEVQEELEGSVGAS